MSADVVPGIAIFTRTSWDGSSPETQCSPMYCPEVYLAFLQTSSLNAPDTLAAENLDPSYLKVMLVTQLLRSLLFWTLASCSYLVRYLHRNSRKGGVWTMKRACA